MGGWFFYIEQTSDWFVVVILALILAKQVEILKN